MFRFRQAADVAFVLLFVFITSNVHARGINQDDAGDNLASGVLLDRLSPKHQKTWLAIRQVIYSEDANGNALHRVLRGLFEQLQTSGHAIYLEFNDSTTGCRCVAGEFLIERLDSAGSRNVGVIKLYPRIIDRASAPLRASQQDGFVPFAGLNKLDRYAEVLGHEMAHAVDILFTPERAHLVDKVLRQSEHAIRQRLSRRANIGPDLERIIQERDAFLGELEKPARITEAMVWRELVGSRKKRKV